MKWSAEEFAQQIGAFRRQLAGVVRRMSISLTDGGAWQTVGHLLFGADVETRDPEHYPGIGVYARPPAGSASAEAIVLQVGGQNQPAIVATRDEATRGKVADIAADEVVIYTSLSRVHVKADGTIEIRTHDGTAVALATKDDLDVLRSAIASAVIGLGAGGAATINAAADLTLSLRVPPTGPWPNGTKKLKGE